MTKDQETTPAPNLTTWGGPRKNPRGRPRLSEKKTGKSLPYRLPIDRYHATVGYILSMSLARSQRPGQVIVEAIRAAHEAARLEGQQ